MEPKPNSAPTIEAFWVPGRLLYPGDEATFRWTARDADRDALRCVFDPTGQGPEIIIEKCAGDRRQTYVYPKSGTFLPTLSVSDGQTTTTTRDNLTIRGDFRVYVVMPVDNMRVDQDMPVRATVDSPLEVSTVRAIVAGRSTELTLDAAREEFTGTLSLAGLPRGEHILEVVAEDVTGNTAPYLRGIIYDQRPKVEVFEPVTDSVASPLIRVKAKCTDDDPDGCEIRIIPSEESSQPVLLRGMNEIDADVDLSGYDGHHITLRIEARDAARQRTSVFRSIYVDASDKLERVVDLPGQILDFDGERALYRLAGATDDTLTIQDLGTGTAVEVPVPEGRSILQSRAYLTTTGAIFVTTVTGSTSSPLLQEWNATELLTLGPINSFDSLRIAGRYALYSDDRTLFLRNLDTGVTSTAAIDAGNIHNDVVSDGTVAYWNRNYEVLLVRNGSPVELTDDATLWNVYPRTDGERAVYRKQSPCCGNRTYAIVLNDGTGETVLRDATPEVPEPGRDYQIVPGWVAYTDLGNLLQRHVWVRDASGNAQQLTLFGTSSSIDRLAEDGTIMLMNQRKRYLAAPNGPLEEAGSVNGQSYLIDGQWYLGMGRTLFRVLR